MYRGRNREIAKASLDDVQAVILCGGAGSRLREVLPGVPKALAPVAGRPFLDHVLQLLVVAGVREAVLCIGVHGEALRERYRENGWPGLSLMYSEEHEPLGTAGAVKHAEKWMHGELFLVLNGDTYLEVDLAEFVARHVQAEAALTMALAEVQDAARYGLVECASQGRITKFIEKNGSNGSGRRRAPALINAGWYVVSKRILEKLPVAPPAVSLESQILPKLIGNGLYGYCGGGFFIDIGVPEDYRRAQTELCGRQSLASANTR